MSARERNVKNRMEKKVKDPLENEPIVVRECYKKGPNNQRLHHNRNKLRNQVVSVTNDSFESSYSARFQLRL